MILQRDFVSAVVLAWGLSPAKPKLPAAHAAYLLAYRLHLDLNEPVGFPGRNTAIKGSCSYITAGHCCLLMIQVFPLDLKEGSNTAEQILFGLRALKELGPAIPALGRSFAALGLLTEMNENSQH